MTSTFHETPLPGAFVVEPDVVGDDRGHFARLHCVREFEARGLEGRFVQTSLSFNKRRGTLRGLHFQTAPGEEVKLVRCVRGRAFDVLVDLRPDSRSYLRHFARELSPDDGWLHYIPRGVAHGFQTLADDTELLYLITEFYEPDLARGVRWNDPKLGIRWPLEPTMISARDQALPLIA